MNNIARHCLVLPRTKENLAKRGEKVTIYVKQNMNNVLLNVLQRENDATLISSVSLLNIHISNVKKKK